jgi:predicted DsbA family dithiol-disulfide isomerase
MLIPILSIGATSCHSQNKKNMQEQNNPLMCDPKNGICEIPANKTSSAVRGLEKSKIKPIKIIYYTDPICSSCWGIEPQLRKLKLEYGNHFEIEYRMGGLLPNWSYNSGGISKPSDVAHHWDEVSVYYDMPIDGNVWLEDPLASSYPPSIAFKAAQMQDNEKAVFFLREIREMVFLQKKNITKWEYLEWAGKKVGLDIVKFKTDYEGKAKELFEQDLKLSRELGVSAFPTLFFTDTMGNKEIVIGSKPYATFENSLLKMFPGASKTNYDKTWNFFFTTYHSLTAKEFTELSGTSRVESEKQLNDLVRNGNLEKFPTKNGSIWMIKNTSR